jgi:hypothetical protein
MLKKPPGQEAEDEDDEVDESVVLKDDEKRNFVFNLPTLTKMFQQKVVSKLVKLEVAVFKT